MKGIVVYYSGTGNTAKIAKAIHRGMKKVIECDISSIKKIDPKEMGKYDVVAVGSPVWYYRETANTRLFIYKMPDMSGKLCIPFCTHGASPTGIFWSMVPMLQQKGLIPIGWGDWYGGAEQVLHAPKPYLTDGHPDKIDIEEAEEFGKEMAERAVKIAAGDKSLIPEIPKGKSADYPWRPQKPFKNFPSEGEKPGDNAPGPVMSTPVRKVDRSKCKYPECTLCIDICPVMAIDFSKDPVVFRSSCLNCALCNKLCPEFAINLDEVTMKNRTQHVINTEKCKYPECTLCLDHCPMDSICLLYTSPSPRDRTRSRMPSSA